MFQFCDSITMLSLRKVANTCRVHTKLIILFKNIAKQTYQHDTNNAKTFITNKKLSGFSRTQNPFSIHGFRGCYSRAKDDEDEDEDYDKCSELGEEIDYKRVVNQSVNYRLPMCDVVLRCGPVELISCLERWIKEGNVITRPQVMEAMEVFNSMKLYKRAFDVSCWLFTKKPFEFDESDYATHLELLFKFTDVSQAEQYFQDIPLSMKGVHVHRALLNGYVNTKNIKKSEDVFKNMNELGLDMDVRDYNSMLLLYSLTTPWRIPGILNLMEDKNIKAIPFTYQVLISVKSSKNDIAGMLDMIDKMKGEGLAPNVDILVALAMQYIGAEMVDKAEQTLGKAERLCNREKEFSIPRRHIIRKLLWPYAVLKREKDVERYWREIESDFNVPLKDYIVGISAWGRLGNIAKAEEIFEKLLDSNYRIWGIHYNELLKVYANHSLDSKAEELMRRMSKSGIKTIRSIRTTLIRMYANMGNLQKAESMLFDDHGTFRLRPPYKCMLLILQKYTERGDAENAEKIFNKVRKVRYKRGFIMYKTLLQAYIKAKVPARGLREEVETDYHLPKGSKMSLITMLDDYERIQHQK